MRTSLTGMPTIPSRWRTSRGHMRWAGRGWTWPLHAGIRSIARCRPHLQRRHVCRSRAWECWALPWLRRLKLCQHAQCKISGTRTYWHSRSEHALCSHPCKFLRLLDCLAVHCSSVFLLDPPGASLDPRFSRRGTAFHPGCARCPGHLHHADVRVWDLLHGETKGEREDDCD